MDILDDQLVWLLLAISTISILIGIPKKGKVAWAKEQFVVLAWMSYLWVPAILTILLIKYFGYW